MKASNETNRSFNFKKAFIVFFAALLVFIAIATIVQVANGRWEAAVNAQNSRFEARPGGDISTMLELRASRDVNRAFTRNPGDRVLYGLAGMMTRFNRAEFTAFSVFGALFRIAFVVLVISWLYTKLQNRNNKTPQHECQCQ